MPFLAGDYRLEKNAETIALHFGFTLTLHSAAVPDGFLPDQPLSPAIVGIVTANGAGILLPAVTFASLAPTSATAPVIGLEIADGMFGGTTANVLSVYGTVKTATGASNINAGSPIYSTAVYASPGVGVGFNVNFGLFGTITGLAQSISAANGTLTGVLTVIYQQR